MLLFYNNTITNPQSAADVSKTLPEQQEVKIASPKLRVTTAFDPFPGQYHLQVSLMVTAVVPHVVGTVYDKLGSLSHVMVPSLATWIYL